jgi:hypothetical protein
MKRIIAIAALSIVASALPSRATLFVRELWDNVTNGAPVNGNQYPLQGQINGTTSYGYYNPTNASFAWKVNGADPVATNALVIGNGDIQDWQVGLYGYLPASWTAPSTLQLVGGNTNGFDSGTWATRALASSAWIHLNTSGTNYFSFRWIKRGLWWSVNGTNGYGQDDTGLGLGFASGNTTNAFFIGIGITRSVARDTYTGTGYWITNSQYPSGVDIGDTPYITAGALGQGGYPGHPGDSGGPYYVQAFAGDGSGSGITNQCEGWTNGYPIMTNGNTYMEGGVLVGRIVTTVSGNTEIDVKNYSGADPYANAIDQTNNPMLGGMTGWDAIYNYTTNVTLNSLLVWMYGNNNGNPCAIDAIRVANTWSEILGQEAQTPIISPVYNASNTLYSGMNVTFSETAHIDGEFASPLTGWYEWLYNSNATLGANAIGIGSNSFYIPNAPQTAAGYYSVVFSNGWETGSSLLVTSPPVILNMLPASQPVFTTVPQGGGRYSAPGTAPFTLNCNVIGTPPFTFKWYQITSGGVTNLLQTVGPTNGGTNFLTLTAPIPPSAAGTYFVNVSNPQGTTNCPLVPFSVIVPTPGSYAAQVVSNMPWAYWRLDEPYGTTNLHDYFGGNDGAILDPTNMVTIGTNAPVLGGVFQQEPAAPYAGFPANHVGIYIPLTSYFALARVNMPGLGNYGPGMTWMGWVYAPNPNSTGTQDIEGEAGAIIWNRDLNDYGGYGNAFGVAYFESITGGVTNYNELGYRWGGGAENPGLQYYGYYWPSGLYAPTNSWYFVAMVWAAPNSATMYLGTNTGPLTVASTTLPAKFDPNYPGTSYSNSFSILLGRGGYPWTETEGSAQDNANVYMSDVAIFTNALSSNAIYQIYLAAMSELITTTNSAGNLVLSWPEGTLLSSTNVQGPYTPVAGATSPWTVSKTTPKQFFRVQK